MFNRRIIRIKVLQTLFAFKSGSWETLKAAENDLIFAFDRAYDLAFNVILLIIEMQAYSKNKIEQAKHKYLPSEEELNPNTKFIRNKLIEKLRSNEQVKEHLVSNKYTWTKNHGFVKDIYEEFAETEYFKQYIVSEDESFRADKRLVILFVTEFLYNSENFYSTAKEESLYWADSIDFVLKSVGNFLKNIYTTDNEDKKILSKFKNDADFDFGVLLLHKSLLKQNNYIEIVKKNINNWDFERIAFIDKTIIQLALAELIEFDEIPIKVTLNEYIELAKLYGIPKKSSNFVNGILDKIVKELINTGEIKKEGRGLMDKNI